VKVRYTRRALRQVTEVLDYIEARSPSGAENVKRRLQDVIDVLADHPASGHATNKKNLRRFVVSPYPYAIFYRADAAGIVIYAVRHTARRPL
jgi:plasmid stabilization system protein ParE